jgi:hypothetical protein
VPSAAPVDSPVGPCYGALAPQHHCQRRREHEGLPYRNRSVLIVGVGVGLASRDRADAQAQTIKIGLL